MLRRVATQQQEDMKERTNERWLMRWWHTLNRHSRNDLRMTSCERIYRSSCIPNAIWSDLIWVTLRIYETMERLETMRRARNTACYELYTQRYVAQKVYCTTATRADRVVSAVYVEWICTKWALIVRRGGVLESMANIILVCTKEYKDAWEALLLAKTLPTDKKKLKAHFARGFTMRLRYESIAPKLKNIIDSRGRRDS